MNNDPHDAGHALRRRQTLILLGTAGSGFLQAPAAAQPVPVCVTTPEQTEGPFFVDERLLRSDIRADTVNGVPRPGIPLTLSLRISEVQSSGCATLTGALVDVWHCDATGQYSGTREAPAARFLRGQQLTDAHGEVRFMTIYPGWYPGRAVHVHFKVRAKAMTRSVSEFTSQIYFDDAVTDRVMTRPPYTGRDDRGRVRNGMDGIYRRGGAQLMAALVAHSGGYAASFNVGLRL